MATFNLALNYGYTLRLVVNQGTQSIPNNTTVASYEFAIHQGSSWWGEYYLDGISWSVRSPANNAFTSGTRTPGYDFRNTSKVVIKSGTRTVSHASNGTYSVRWEGHWAGQHTRVGGGAVGGTVTFSTIPRASSFTAPGTVTTGNSATISISRHSSSFTHDVAYRIGSGSWTNIATGVGTSTTWTPPHTLFNSHPTSSSLSGTFRVITKSGSTQIGSAATKSFTLNLNSNQTPTVSSVVWHDQNPLTNNMGAFIQHKSILKGTVNATGVVGSTINRRELIVQGNTFLDSNLINPGSAGSITASGRAVDSRGRSATKAANFTVLPYSEPNIINYQASRSTPGGTITPDGTSVRVDLNVAASSIVVGGEEKNALTIKVRTKPAGAPNSQWQTRHTINTGTTYNDWFVIPSATFSVDQTYDIGVVVTDNLHTGPETAVIRPISTEAVTMHWKGNNVGIGKRHEHGVLDVAGDGYFAGKVHDNSGQLSPAGSIVMFGGSSAPAGWLLCQGQAVSRTTYSDLFAAIGTTYGAGDGTSTFNVPNLQGRVPVGFSSGETEFNALGKAGGAKTHTLTVSQIPSHNHSASTNSAGGHTHRIVGGNNNTTRLYSGGATPGGSASDRWHPWFGSGWSGRDNVYTTNAGSHTHSVTVNNTGSGNAHNNLQPYMSVNFIIKY